MHSDDDEPPDDGPTVAADFGGMALQMQQAAAGSPLGDSAKPAPIPQTQPSPGQGMQASAAVSQRSPFSSTGYTPSGAGASKTEEEETNEAATVTVPKDVLDRVRADPKAVLAESKPKAPVPAAGRPYSDIDDSAEPTKAVARDELLGRASADAQGGHVVIGADAGGEDATLAVAPGANEASGMNLGAAIGSALASGTLQSPLGDGAFPPPHDHGQGQGQPHPYQSYQGMGPQGAPNPMGYGGHPGMGMQGQPQNQPWSSGHMPAANPRTPGGVQSYGGGPMMQHPQQQGMAPGNFPRGQAPTNWNPLQAPPAKSKISGQMILLFVVGFVCLAIFVTGIVLFATTKF